MKVDIKVTGYNEIDAVLKGLPLQMSHSVIQSANIAASKPLVQAEKLLAPEGPTGNLVDSIGAVRTPIKKANEIGEISVGPRRRGGYKGYAAHLVEYGTKQRRLKKNGANRGTMPAEPFAVPAFQRTKEQVLSIINTEIGKKLFAFMSRTIKRHG
jgi:HK97 gp10 family phage protein